MANIQWNALSTNLFGSFEALTILPDAAQLQKPAGTRYPVLYLLHDNGENAQQFLAMPELEKLCCEKELVICCPWISHSFGQDLRWGGKFGRFAAEEFPGICAHMFPVDPEKAMLGGIGWGAYAACSLARRFPGSFRRVLGFNGHYDVSALCADALAGREDPLLSRPMLEAAFGDPASFAGSEKDLLCGDPPAGLMLGCSQGLPEAETRQAADRWNLNLYVGSLAQLISEAM